MRSQPVSLGRYWSEASSSSPPPLLVCARPTPAASSPSDATSSPSPRGTRCPSPPERDGAAATTSEAVTPASDQAKGERDESETKERASRTRPPKYRWHRGGTALAPEDRARAVPHRRRTVPGDRGRGRARHD